MPRKSTLETDEILNRAMQVFWQRGYKETSVEDLIQEAGINRFNLYESFGGKHGLYLAALDLYRDQIVLPRMENIDRQSNAMTGICNYFENLYTFLIQSKGKLTCLMMNSQIELVPQDSEVTGKVRLHFNKMEDTFFRALKRAKKTNQLCGENNLRDLARFLTGSAQGMCVMSKGNNVENFLKSYLRTILKTITNHTN